MSKPTVFIGSSPGGLPVAHALRQTLEADADALIWTEQIFLPAELYLDSLFRALDKVDFAILVLTPDDALGLGRTRVSPSRDSLLFELGLFIGRLGAERTFVVVEETNIPSQLPTDVLGINIVRFRRTPGAGPLAGLDPASMHIREHIKRAKALEQSKTADAEVDRYTCFISYSSHDKEIAKRIYEDLQDVGIRCWLDSKDLKIGDDFSVEIQRSVRLSDKILLILSQSSVNSDWVRREIDLALKRESEIHRTVLFPIRIDDAVMKSKDAYSRNLVMSKHVGDFTDWTDEWTYKSAFSRLVKDLAVSAAAEQDRTSSNA